MVRGAVKPQEASASQVRCTCSMQGLKAQKTPSGRRHASADLTTCTVGFQLSGQASQAMRVCEVQSMIMACPAVHDRIASQLRQDV